MALFGDHCSVAFVVVAPDGGGGGGGESVRTRVCVHGGQK